MLNKEYWEIFEALRRCNEVDFDKVIASFQKNFLFAHAVKFIVSRAKFLEEKDLQHMKADMKSVMNIYKLYAIHFITQQAVNVSEMTKKKSKKKNANN